MTGPTRFEPKEDGWDVGLRFNDVRKARDYKTFPDGKRSYAIMLGSLCRGRHLDAQINKIMPKLGHHHRAMAEMTETRVVDEFEMTEMEA